MGCGCNDVNAKTETNTIGRIAMKTIMKILDRTRRLAMPFACLLVFAVSALAPSNASAVVVYKPYASISYPNCVYLRWTGTTGATQYRVYRGTSTSISRASLIGTVGGSVRDAYDYTPRLGVKYYYWIMAKVGRTWYYASKRYDYGYRKFTLTWGTVSNGTRVWLKAYVNGMCLATTNVSWSLSKSGVHVWHRNRSCPYLGYFTSTKRGRGTYTLKVGSSVVARGRGTINWS